MGTPAPGLPAALSLSPSPIPAMATTDTSVCSSSFSWSRCALSRGGSEQDPLPGQLSRPVGAVWGRPRVSLSPTQRRGQGWSSFCCFQGSSRSERCGLALGLHVGFTGPLLTGNSWLEIQVLGCAVISSSCNPTTRATGRWPKTPSRSKTMRDIDSYQKHLPGEDDTTTP